MRVHLVAQTEAQAFLSWLESGHFTFLGYRDWDLVGGEVRPAARPALGLLALEEAEPLLVQMAQALEATRAGRPWFVPGAFNKVLVAAAGPVPRGLKRRVAAKVAKRV